MSRTCVRRIGQIQTSATTPYYRYVGETPHWIMVEYCGNRKMLPKDKYEVFTTNEADHGEGSV